MTENGLPPSRSTIFKFVQFLIREKVQIVIAF